ncbi:MAG: hypothetical protein J0M12_12665 [Deltaproteobacteria bacterium]|nr:hypothetical protein [Deltaproteobacteria bacterium]
MVPPNHPSLPVERNEEPPALRSQIFTGRFEVALDRKERFCLPSPLRSDFSQGGAYITRSPDACLWIFPHGEFLRILHELQGASLLSNSGQLMKAYFLNSSYRTTLDSAGRLRFPPELRPGFLTRDESGRASLVLIGSGNLIEAWPAKRYQEHIDAMLAKQC